MYAIRSYYVYGLLHDVVIKMPFDIQEENVFPGLFLQGSALDLGEIDLTLAEP